VTIWGWKDLVSDVQDSISGRPADGFDTVRLVSAFLVILGHASVIATGSGNIIGTKAGVDLGALGVSSFMALSGFLVIRSWENDPHLWRYFVKRFMRIMPGAIVMTFATVFVLGPVLTEIPVRQYFTEPATWTYLWNNIRLFPIQYSLPGVFPNNPLPHVINGSMWSLPVEVVGYAMIGLFGLLGAVRRRYLVIVALLAFATLGQRLWTAQIELPTTTLMIPTRPLVSYLGMYCAGMALHLYRDKIRYSWPAVLVCLAIDFAFYASPTLEVVRMVTLPYVVLAIAHLLPTRFSIPTYLTVASYGVYLYGFPVEQSLRYEALTSPWLLAAGTMALSLGLGLLSWHLVEHPAMRARRHLYFRRRVSAPAKDVVREPSSVD
jgi:peptidoglycan/LPS O-acetylase OafA/YrhL